MAALPHRQFTAEEFAALHRDGWRYELIDGEVITMPAAFSDHGRTAMRLGALVTGYILQHQLGEVFAAETGYLIRRNPDTVRAPDFAFIQASRVTPGATAAFWGTVIPDLVAEVVSSSDRAAEVAAKVQMWLEVGVRLVWVAYLQTRSIVVHRPGADPTTLDDTATLDGGDVVPGFAAPVAAIFG